MDKMIPFVQKGVRGAKVYTQIHTNAQKRVESGPGERTVNYSLWPSSRGIGKKERKRGKDRLSCSLWNTLETFTTRIKPCITCVKKNAHKKIR